MPVMTASQGNKQMQGSGTKTRDIVGSGAKTQKAQLVAILTCEIVGDKGLQDGRGVVLGAVVSTARLSTCVSTSRIRRQDGRYHAPVLDRALSIFRERDITAGAAVTYAKRQPRRHVAHFLDTVAWAGATIREPRAGVRRCVTTTAVAASGGNGARVRGRGVVGREGQGGVGGMGRGAGAPPWARVDWQR